MNKTVELVCLWGAFEENHPNAGIEDFCRYVMAHKANTGMDGSPAKADAEGLLLRTLGRITKMTMIFSANALKGSGVNRIEEAGLLLYVDALKNPKKSEAIYNNLLELSSGVDMMNRLIKRGLLKEFPDEEDRRTKRMRITSKGAKAVEKCKRQLKRMAQMMTADMSRDDMMLCFKLLKGIDEKFTPVVLNMKNKGFEKIYEEVMLERDQ